MKKNLLFTAIVFGLFASCNSTKPINSNEEKWIIASEQADCTGVAPMKCLMIKNSTEKDWTYFYDHIDGFNYEAGYEYELLVQKSTIENPAADASSEKYRLIKILKKEKKQSDLKR